MKQKQRDLLLCSIALSELKSSYNLLPEEIVLGYNKQKASEYFNQQFPLQPSKEELIKLANESYRRLKIK